MRIDERAHNFKTARALYISINSKKEMKRFLILLLALMPLFAMAQRVPDNEAILARTIDNSSPYYYPRLMERYIHGDTTLTADEYHHLYYGFAFADNYRPLENDPARIDVLEVFVATETPDSTQLLRVIEAAERLMHSDPFSPQNLNILTFAYGKLGDERMERICYDRFTKVMQTIESSGTGRREDSPWHVLTFQHAADFTAWRGGEINNRQVRSRSVEYIQLRVKDADGNRGYFFDFSRVYMKRPEYEKPKEERKWKLNDMPLN